MRLPNAESMPTNAKVGLLGSLYFSQGLPFGFFTHPGPASNLPEARLLSRRDWPFIASCRALGTQAPVGACSGSIRVASHRPEQVLDFPPAARVRRHAGRARPGFGHKLGSPHQGRHALV